MKQQGASVRQLGIAAVLSFWAALSVLASDADSLRTVRGQRVHEVERKETLFGIARAYDLDVNALLAANPSVRAEDALQLGQILILPDPVLLPHIPDVVAPDAPDPLPSHTVAPGETLFGIARAYGTTVEALEAANPARSSDLNPGDRLRIPVGEASPPVPSPATPFALRRPSLPASAVDTLRVLALLPFQFDADTLPSGRYSSKVERLRGVAMEMLSGLRWAADELAAAGIPVVLDIRDSEPDSLGRCTWDDAAVVAADVVMGPLRKSELDSALSVTARLGRAHWILTPQPAALLATHGQALRYAPLEGPALEALGRTVARNHPTGTVLVLELPVEGREEQEAFHRGFAAERLLQGLPADAGWERFEVSTRFATGAADRILGSKPACVVIPSGPTSRAMVANLQTELQLADDRSTRIYLHPQAAEYSFLERAFFEDHRVTLPSQDWINWDDSLTMRRVMPYRDALGVEPSPFAWAAHEALLESARWSTKWEGRVPPPLHARFNWSATGLETGFLNTAWRIQQCCAGQWIEGSEECTPSR